MFETQEQLDKYAKSQSKTVIYSLHDFVYLLNELPEQDIFNKTIRSGLYLANELKPRLFGSAKYLYKQIYDTYGPITGPGLDLDKLDVQKLADDIVDIEGNFVIDRSHILKNTRLYKKPTLDAARFSFLASWIIDFFNQQCSDTPRIRYSDYQVYNWVRKKYREYLYDGTMDEVLRPLHDRLTEWVGEDTWHIYQVRVSETNIYITKTIDVRIYQWHQQRLDEVPF